MNAENRGIFQSCVTGLRRGRAGRIDLRRRGQDVEREGPRGGVAGEDKPRGETERERERERIPKPRNRNSRFQPSLPLFLPPSPPPPSPPPPRQIHPVPPFRPGGVRGATSLSGALPWSRGYVVVEPPRGYRIIIGCQVTRTLSAGFNWPIIVARIEVGAASVQIGVKLLGWPALCAQAQRQRSADFPPRPAIFCHRFLPLVIVVVRATILVARG